MVNVNNTFTQLFAINRSNPCPKSHTHNHILIRSVTHQHTLTSTIKFSQFLPLIYVYIAKQTSTQHYTANKEKVNKTSKTRITSVGCRFKPFDRLFFSSQTCFPPLHIQDTKSSQKNVRFISQNTPEMIKTVQLKRLVAINPLVRKKQISKDGHVRKE